MKKKCTIVLLIYLMAIALAACSSGGGSAAPSTLDTTLPTASSTNPANNATNVALNAAIIATFSEAMDASTITSDTFKVNGVTGNVTYSGTTAQFTPASNLTPSTTYTATITKDVKDSAGNAMANDYTWSFTTGANTDTTAPTVFSTSPANAATGIAVNTAITAVFSEAMTASTINSTTFLINGVAGTITYLGNTATFTPSSNLAFSTVYTATITTDVKDAAGNPLVAAYTWSFTTAANTNPAPDLLKAKAVVTDLRNTVLSIYNYQGGTTPGIVETPFSNLATEVQTKIQPELTATGDRISWILQSAGTVTPGTTQTFTKTPYTLTVSIDAIQTSASFTVRDAGNVIIDTGSLTLDHPITAVTATSVPTTSGVFTATMKTATGNIAVDLNYSATVSGSNYTSMTFTGSMTAPGLSFDFSQSGRKLYLEFTTMAGVSYPVPTLLQFDGVIKSTTAEFDSSMYITAGTNTVSSTGAVLVPLTATITGTFQELTNGTPTGMTLTGTITGNFVNALTYDTYSNTYSGESASNFPIWDATFNGSIHAVTGLTITAYLKVGQTEYQKVTIALDYHRTNADGTVVYLMGSGSYDMNSSTTTLSLTNQDGMIVSVSDGQTLTGTIKTSSGVKMADIYDQNGVIMIKYIDNYIESII
jgi:hypothetical protein